MARIRGRTLGVLLGMVMLGCAATPRSLGRTFHYQVRNETREVSPGHWAGPFQNRGVCVLNVGQKSEEAGLFTMDGTFDGVWTSQTTMSACQVKGAATCRFPDGSSWSDEADLTCGLGPDGKLVTKGSANIVRGTGRFEGIRGTTTILSSVQLSPPPEDLGLDRFELKYTLPGK